MRVTGQDWNWRAPWEKQAPWTRTVTGLVVPGPRILVASTAFGNHLLVEAQKLGAEARTVARVELVDHEGPLALVAVDDPAFWEGLEPLPLAERAPGEGDVTILRWQRTGLLDAYPGTLRQVRSGRHGLSQTSLLTLEIGVSTDGLGESEVVVAKGRVAGLVTGRAGDTYGALAAPVLAQFLAGAAKGDWRSFARAGLAWQDLTNPALRESLGLRPGETGIRLTRVAAHGSAGGVLKPGDVLLEVGRDEARPHRLLRAPSLRADALRAALLRRPAARRHDAGPGPARRPAPRPPAPAPRDAARAGPGSPLRLRPRAGLRGHGRARLPGAHPALPRGLGRLGAPGAAAAAGRDRPGARRRGTSRSGS